MKQFQQVHTIDEVDLFIQENKLSFLYVTMPNCSVCHGLLPQIEAMFTKFPKIATRTVDAVEVKEIAGRFEIFTAPVLLLFVDGKEYLREARIVQTAKFESQVRRLYENVETN